MISVTITDRSGRTLSGQTLDAFYISIEHARPWSIGINCALGAREMRPYLAELARLAECWVSVYPNAGLPNAFGEYDELPAETGALLRDFADSGFANIVGGCCGTTPDHIGRWRYGRAAVAPAADARRRLERSRRPDRRSRPPSRGSSGLEPLIIRPDSNFQMIGERTNVTGSKRFARLIKDDKFAEAAVGRARAGARRREHRRREHGRRHARLRAGDDDVPELHRDRAGNRARAGHDRQLEVVGHRGRPQVRAGQAASSTRSR